MSPYTTLFATRSTAKRLIKKKNHQFSKISEYKEYSRLLQEDPDLVCDETMECIMDILLEERLYNCVIVPDYSSEQDDSYLDSILNN